jgi:hypothetical protein
MARRGNACCGGVRVLLDLLAGRLGLLEWFNIVEKPRQLFHLLWKGPFRGKMGQYRDSKPY